MVLLFTKVLKYGIINTVLRKEEDGMLRKTLIGIGLALMIGGVVTVAIGLGYDSLPKILKGFEVLAMGVVSLIFGQFFAPTPLPIPPSVTNIPK